MIADKNIKSFLVLQKMFVIRLEHVMSLIGVRNIKFCLMFVAFSTQLCQQHTYEFCMEISRFIK